MDSSGSYFLSYYLYNPHNQVNQLLEHFLYAVGGFFDTLNGAVQQFRCQMGSKRASFAGTVISFSPTLQEMG